MCVQLYAFFDDSENCALLGHLWKLCAWRDGDMDVTTLPGTEERLGSAQAS